MDRLLPALVLAVGVIAAAAILGQGLQQFRMSDRSIVIKGLAEQTVDSDFATWDLNVRRAGDSFASVQQALATDRDRVVAFLRERGFSDDELEIRPLVVIDAYSREYASANSPTRYSGSGLVVVKSGRVDAVQTAALATDPLIAVGVQLDVGTGPQYELRALNAAKGPLLQAAVNNAKTQAASFAEQAGADLGALKSANQGVIQISGVGGNRYDSGTSREKRLRVVSTFTYYLR
ncbi:MAG: SIMPL domain-containing protein [Pseudomonadota bacterium]